MESTKLDCEGVLRSALLEIFSKIINIREGTVKITSNSAGEKE
jgi:hypothetical protein